MLDLLSLSQDSYRRASVPIGTSCTAHRHTGRVPPPSRRRRWPNFPATLRQAKKPLEHRRQPFNLTHLTSLTQLTRPRLVVRYIHLFHRILFAPNQRLHPQITNSPLDKRLVTLLSVPRGAHG